MATVGNWRAASDVVEQVDGRSPFAVVFGLVCLLFSNIFCFAVSFLIFFLPVFLFPNYEKTGKMVSESTYDFIRGSLQSFYASTQESTGIIFIVLGFGISLAYALAALYGRASWRLFFLILGFASCCTVLHMLSIDFAKTDISVHLPSFGLSF